MCQLETSGHRSYNPSKAENPELGLAARRRRWSAHLDASPGAEAMKFDGWQRLNARAQSSSPAKPRARSPEKESPPMNVLLWVLQVALALLSLAGGAYKVFQFDELAKVPAAGALSRSGWGVIGVFEMLCAVFLIVPAAAKWMPALTPLAAAALTLESLALAVLYARYSLALTAANPLVYVVVMGLMAAFVAYGRYALGPPA
jgi:hypothetical protein